MDPVKKLSPAQLFSFCLILSFHFSPLLLAFAKRFGGARWRPARHLWLLILLAGGGAGREVAAQTPGEWTWMHGNNTPNPLGVFGVKGVSNPANTPPGLYEPCEWRDNNGDFWLLGGRGAGGAGNIYYNTLWKYTVSINEWTWVNGSSVINQTGVYGTQGISAPANCPSSRTLGAVTWVDASGNLWLFGGYGYDALGAVGSLNDLWRYTIATNEWTWMKGPNTVSNPGSYGTLGTSTPANLPPARHEISASWTDNANNLWLYGGEDVSNFVFGDLWKYDIGTNNWTWMHGANTLNAVAVYGTQGTAALANTPGGMDAYASWVDLSGSNLWLFGGVTASGRLNDLWKYDIAANQWTWVKGPGTNNNTGNYGTKCVSTNTNLPPSRFENRARVRDACGNFWNFGGLSSTGWLNDLWHYNISTNQWTWVSGDNIINQVPVYGVLGISAPANKPGGRYGNVSWIDTNGYIWIFGGLFTGGDAYNDLFRYVPDPSCVPFSTVVAASSNITICNGQSATLTASGSTSYSWSAGGQTTSSIVVNPAGSTTYTVIGTGSCGPGSDSVIVTVISPFVALASGATICSGQNATVSASGGSTYAWSNGATTTSINVAPAATTTYSVIVSVGSCSDTTLAIVTVNPSPFPLISGNSSICAGDTAMFTATGGSTYVWNTGASTSVIAVSPAVTTSYSVTAINANGCSNTAFVTLGIFPPPIALASSATICLGQQATLSASGGSAYAWSNGATTASTIITSLVSTITYSVIVSIGSCSDTANAVVIVNPNPTTTALSTNISCNGGSDGTAAVAATGGTSGYTYLWSPVGGTNAVATGLSSGTYTAVVTDANGCSSTQIATIEPSTNAGEFYLPNAFSPNRDGENDEFCLLGGIEDCINKLRINIYDRWGGPVFESEDPKFCWEGTYDGKRLNTAVFVYFLEATLISGEAVTKRGNISLIR